MPLKPLRKVKNPLKTAAQQANEQLANGEITQQQYDALQREIVGDRTESATLTSGGYYQCDACQDR